jgi:hypothetical protein
LPGRTRPHPQQTRAHTHAPAHPTAQTTDLHSNPACTQACSEVPNCLTCAVEGSSDDVVCSTCEDGFFSSAGSCAVRQGLGRMRPLTRA